MKALTFEKDSTSYTYTGKLVWCKGILYQCMLAQNQPAGQIVTPKYKEVKEAPIQSQDILF